MGPAAAAGAPQSNAVRDCSTAPTRSVAHQAPSRCIRESHAGSSKVGTSPLCLWPVETGCRQILHCRSDKKRGERPHSLSASLGNPPASCEQDSASTIVISLHALHCQKMTVLSPALRKF